MLSPAGQESDDSTHKLNREQLYTAKECGWASIACNVPFILYVLVNPNGCHPDAVAWFYITTGLLGLSLILAVLAALAGPRRWGFAAIAPPVVFVVGLIFLLLNIRQMIC
jgi:hypothetical protein